ncbi:hypothetical protein J6590_066615 [Homalodisca vitripennis]|nr:hypothetical protein J6590_066615 [Homalodisca vitripennis]
MLRIHDIGPTHSRIHGQSYCLCCASTTSPTLIHSFTNRATAYAAHPRHRPHSFTDSRTELLPMLRIHDIGPTHSRIHGQSYCLCCASTTSAPIIHRFTDRATAYAAHPRHRPHSFTDSRTELLPMLRIHDIGPTHSRIHGQSYCLCCASTTSVQLIHGFTDRATAYAAHPLNRPHSFTDSRTELLPMLRIHCIGPTHSRIHVQSYCLCCASTTSAPLIHGFTDRATAYAAHPLHRPHLFTVSRTELLPMLRIHFPFPVDLRATAYAAHPLHRPHSFTDSRTELLPMLRIHYIGPTHSRIHGQSYCLCCASTSLFQLIYGKRGPWSNHAIHAARVCGQECTVGERDSSHYCGHNLVQALQLVCNSAYQTLYSFCLLTDKDVSLTQDSCLVADGLPDAARVCGQECTVGEERLVPLLWSQLGTGSTAGV